MKFVNASLVKKLLIVSCLFSFVSCTAIKRATTYIPPQVKEEQPSWDGNEQNSGVIKYTKGRGFLLTPTAAARYTMLSQKYGEKMNPPIKIGEGLSQEENSPNVYLDNQHMAYFMTMNQMYKNSLAETQ